MTQHDAITIIKTIAKHAIDVGLRNPGDIVDAVAQTVGTFSPSPPSKDVRQTVAHNLRRVMKEEGIKNYELAEWTGLHVNTIIGARQGHRYITLDKLVAIAKVLRRPMADFFKE